MTTPTPLLTKGELNEVTPMARRTLLLCIFAISCLSLRDSTYAESQVKSQKEATRAQIGRCSASIHGRLWDFTSRPIPDGYVFALNENEKTVLGHSPTKRERGPDQGGWWINDLPAGRIVLIGFDTQLSLGLAFAQLTLKACEDKFFNTLTTTISVPNIAPGGTPEGSRPGAGAAPLLLLDLLGVVAREANRIITGRQADDVRRRLRAFAESERGGAPSRELPERWSRPRQAGYLAVTSSRKLTKAWEVRFPNSIALSRPVVTG